MTSSQSMQVKKSLAAAGLGLMSFLTLAGMASAQTTATTGTTGTVTTTATPGVPTTGAGGQEAMNVAVLTASALIAVAGLALIRRDQKAVR